MLKDMIRETIFYHVFILYIDNICIIVYNHTKVQRQRSEGLLWKTEKFI